MEKSEKITLGISIGDFNGVGIEIILKTFLDKRMFDFCTPVLFGSAKLITAYKKNMDINLLFNGIRQVDAAIQGKFNVLNLWKDEFEVNRAFQIFV